MKDIQGNTIRIGDKVAYILGAKSSPRLETGTVTNIMSNGYSCSVDGHPNIYAHRILKLS